MVHNADPPGLAPLGLGLAERGHVDRQRVRGRVGEDRGDFTLLGPDQGRCRRGGPGHEQVRGLPHAVPAGQGVAHRHAVEATTRGSTARNQPNATGGPL